MGMEFTPPEFIDNNTPEEIQSRMMNALPEGIDDMPGGFPYDFTMPTAIEKSELIQFHLVRTLMLMFPQFAWGEWLDLHASVAGVQRKPPGYASGEVTVTGEAGTVIMEGSIFCTASTDDSPSLEYAADHTVIIPEGGTVKVPVTAVNPGKESNTKAKTVTFSLTTIKGLSKVENEDWISGGTDEESDEALWERIDMEYKAEGPSFIGNDNDYERWAKEVTGIGDCIVIPASEENPGVVKLVLVDSNGSPANKVLVQAVYDHIVSPNDRSKRILPTGCAKLIVEAAETKTISYTCTGLVYDETTDIEQISKEFKELVAQEYIDAKKDGMLIYNQVRALITDIPGVSDFDTFLMNGKEENIVLGKEEYAATGDTNFS